MQPTIQPSSAPSGQPTTAPTAFSVKKVDFGLISGVVVTTGMAGIAMAFIVVVGVVTNASGVSGYLLTSWGIKLPSKV
jgi:hypothetical protein